MFCEPILREVVRALFEILHTHNLRHPIPTDENELVVEIHECRCQEYPLHILASRFQIVLLQACNLYVLPGMT